MRRQLGWAWFAIVGGAMVACLPVSAPPDQPAGTRTACTPGVAFCDDNVARLCGDNGYVSDRVICEDTQTCVLGACEDNLVCVPDAFLCIRNELVRCNADGTALSSRQDCGEAFCVNGACVPAGGQCPPGQAYCDGNRAALCNADGSGTVGEPTACGSEGLCVGGQCSPIVCDAGKSSCEGNLSRTCDLWGTGYSEQSLCTDGLVCVRGRCLTQVCQPASRVCQANRAITCSDDGTSVIEDRECGPDKVCQDGRCVAGTADGGGWDQAVQDAGSPDLARPDTAIADAAQPDTARPDAVAPDLARPDTALPDTATPDTVGPDAAPPDCDPIDDAYEQDDSRGTASVISLGATLQDLVACDPADWFRLDVPAGSALRVTISFVHSEADLDLEVYRNADTALFDESATTADSESVEMWDAPATAYVRVVNYSYPTKVGHYTLAAERIDPPVCGDGIVNGDERCDINIASGSAGACPTSCTDSGCNHYTLTGTGTCQAGCQASAITACSSSDECCPVACTATTDTQCADLGYTACSSDAQCPADRYCDLARQAPVCKLGCRLSSPSGCDGAHTCAADHRCVLTNVIPHQRCAACSERDPCAGGFECDTFSQQCSPVCSVFADDCATTVGADSTCNLLLCLVGPCVCTQDDCP